MAILMVLILIREHGTCFHLFVSSLISFFNVVQFSEYRSFTCLVRFIPRYFIFLVAMSNRTFFLISVSDISLLAYRAFLPLSSWTLWKAAFRPLPHFKRIWRNQTIQRTTRRVRSLNIISYEKQSNGNFSMEK